MRDFENGSLIETMTHNYTAPRDLSIYSNADDEVPTLESEELARNDFEVLFGGSVPSEQELYPSQFEELADDLGYPPWPPVPSQERPVSPGIPQLYADVNMHLLESEKSVSRKRHLEELEARDREFYERLKWENLPEFDDFFGASAPPQEESAKATQALAVERPDFHHHPQQPGAPIPTHSHFPATAPDEADPPQQRGATIPTYSNVPAAAPDEDDSPRKRVKPNTAPPRRPPKAESVRKTNQPLGCIEQVLKSRLHHGYLQYRVKFMGIPQDELWYDSIGFKTIYDLTQIGYFHRTNPEADNAHTSAVWFATKSAKQDAKAEAKYQAKAN